MPRHLGDQLYSGITTFEQELRLKHQAPIPSGADAGYGRMFVNDADGYLYFLDAYGDISQVSAGGGSVGAAAGGDGYVQFNNLGIQDGAVHLRYDDTNGITLVGDTADSAAYPYARMIVSQADAGLAFVNHRFGIVGEAVANDSIGWGMGVAGMGSANAAQAGIGLYAVGTRNDAADTGTSYGVYSRSTYSHTGGDNVALFAWATGGSLRQDALRIQDGDIQTVAALDWDLVQDDAAALSFDTGLYTLLELDTTDDAYQVRIGDTADSADFPNARMIVSYGDTAHTDSFQIGLLGESVSTTQAAAGVYGVVKADAFTGNAIEGWAQVVSSSSPGTAVGANLISIDTHAGGWNIAAALNASGGASNYAIFVTAGDINTVAAIDWDLKDNDGYALSFDSPGHAGIMNIDTTTGFEGVLFGATTIRSDCPGAAVMGSKGNVGEVYPTRIGVRGEATSGTGDSFGIYGLGKTSSAAVSYGVYGSCYVSDPSDTTDAFGVYSYVFDTHTGGDNVALHGVATGSSVGNYALQMNGDIRSLNNPQDWDLLDNDGYALSFDTTGYEHLLVLDTTNDAEMVRIGQSALPTDNPSARLIVSNGNTGNIYNATTGIQVEAVSASGLESYGITSYAKSDGSNPAYGIFSQAYPTNSSDTTDLYGVYGNTNSANAGYNIGLYTVSTGSTKANYGLWIGAGDIRTQSNTDWNMIENNVLSFNSTNFDEDMLLAGLLAIDTTTGSEQVITNVPIKIQSGGVDESEFMLLNHNGTDGYIYSGKGTVRIAGDLAVDGYNFAGPKYDITTSKTSSYNAVLNEVVRVDPSGGGFTVSLPDPTDTTGETIVVKNTTSSTNIITIDSIGGESIDGQSSVTIQTGFESLTFVSYGIEWGII